jgi:predicted N-acetyltransferase YhbS
MTASASPRVAPALDLDVRLAPERPQDRARVDALVEAAFGPGRFAKAAERVREQARRRANLSVCAWAGDDLIGAVRLWDIRIGAADALFLGPIEVAPSHRRRGLAALLTQQACDTARQAGERLVLLVGEGAIFIPMGFEPVPPGRISLPGPVDAKRLFWRALTPGGTQGVSGAVTSPRSDAANNAR